VIVLLHCLLCDWHEERRMAVLPGGPVPCERAGCNASIEPQVVAQEVGEPVVASPWAQHPHRSAWVKGHRGYET